MKLKQSKSEWVHILDIVIDFCGYSNQYVSWVDKVSIDFQYLMAIIIQQIMK